MRCQSCGTLIKSADIKRIVTRSEDVPRVRRFLGSFMGKGLTRSEVESGIAVEVHGKIVGYVEALIFGANAYLCRLKVHKAFRGQGQGRSLLLDALDRVLSRGAETAFAITQPGRSAARILESLGAERISKPELLAAMPEVPIARCDQGEYDYWKLELEGGR
jgi:ribosomal protein S18 acetylase RimI-like enzyme